MTAPRDDLTAALHRLRGAVRDEVPVPPAAGLRAWATRRQRVRSFATAALAAAAVTALAIGGAQVIDRAAGPPAAPAGTPTPAASPTAPSPTTSPSPTASPQPPSLPAVTPSPRPAPLPVTTPGDPIAQVDWGGSVTIDIPAREGCPEGHRAFTDGISGGPDGPFPGVAISSTPGEGGQIAYGDVNGDGRLEAVIDARCFGSLESLGSGHGWQLLVVARADDGTLTGLGWVGPLNANIQAVWVSQGQVLMDGDPWTVDPEDHFPPLPGLALAYQWNGSRFVGWEPAAEYPPITPLDEDGIGPPVWPRAVAAGLGCPDMELRFTRDGPFGGGSAIAGGARFEIPDRYHPAKRHLFDLDHTGQRLLVTALACTDPDGWTREGLAVFERAEGGWQGISVLTPPAGHGWTVDYWTVEGADEVLHVSWSKADGGGAEVVAYRWTGTELVPAP